MRGDLDEDEVDLVKIGCGLTPKDSTYYDCAGSVIHFASFSVLKSCRKANELRKQVGAACVSGYTKSVESTNSWAFELMYLALLSDLLRTKNVNASTLGLLENRIMNKPEYAGLAESLGFKMITEDWQG